MLDCINTYSWLISLCIASFIAYHVYFLSKRLSNKNKLEHREKIKDAVQELLVKIKKESLRKKVYLVNINRYFTDYPDNKEKIFNGYSHIRADIKWFSVEWVLFFSDMIQTVYKNDAGQLSFNWKNGVEIFKVAPVWIVPYEWIEYIDLQGDEYGFVPLFFCHFKGFRFWKKWWTWWRRLLPFGYPYKKIIYYILKDDGNYTLVNQKIYN